MTKAFRKGELFKGPTQMAGSQYLLEVIKNYQLLAVSQICLQIFQKGNVGIDIEGQSFHQTQNNIVRRMVGGQGNKSNSVLKLTIV